MFEIKIYKSTAEEAVQNRQVWTLKMECVSTDSEVSPHIFVYQSTVFDESTGTPGDVFRAVASVTNMVDLPEINAVDGVAYFRLDKATFYCKSAQERLDLEEQILCDIQDLKENILAARQMVNDKNITV